MTRRPDRSITRSHGYNVSLPFVYIVRCSDGTLYTGCAKDLAARLAAHNRAQGAKYTRGRAPVTLVYHEECPTLAEAQQRERWIKKLTRAQKLALTASR